MTTATAGDVTVIVLPTSTHDAIEAAIAARNEGWAQAEAADRSGWDKNLIDQAIDALAETGEPFSANELRELLPDNVRASLMGGRFVNARSRGVIRWDGWTTSTKRNTHGKGIGRYVGVSQTQEAHP